MGHQSRDVLYKRLVPGRKIGQALYVDLYVVVKAIGVDEIIQGDYRLKREESRGTVGHTGFDEGTSFKVIK